MKPNALIQQAAEAEIARRIKRGELLMPETVNKNLLDNLDVWTKMMTIAVNKGLSVGKKRFRERVQPILDQLVGEFFDNQKTVDQEYALSVIERLYDEIMEG